MIAITSKCWLVEMLKCKNVTSDYKRLRILEKFLRSYVYEWRGTPMLCPKSPHRLCLRCQYLSAVTVNICRLSLSKFDTVTTVNICHCYYCAVVVAVVPLCRCRCTVTAVMAVMAVKLMQLNVNIQNLKLFYVEQVPCTKTKLKIVPCGTSAMQSLHV